MPINAKKKATNSVKPHHPLSCSLSLYPVSGWTHCFCIQPIYRAYTLLRITLIMSFHYTSLPCVSHRETVFLVPFDSLSIYLSVSMIMQKQMNGLQQNLVKGWGMGQERFDQILAWICIWKGADVGFLYIFYLYKII